MELPHNTMTGQGDLQHRVPSDSLLTERQAQVMALVSQGLALSQIAKCLGLSVNTVKVHLRFAYRRLGVHSHVSAVNRLRPPTCPHCGGALGNHQRYVA